MSSALFSHHLAPSGRQKITVARRHHWNCGKTYIKKTFSSTLFLSWRSPSHSRWPPISLALLTFNSKHRTALIRDLEQAAGSGDRRLDDSHTLWSLFNPLVGGA